MVQSRYYLILHTTPGYSYIGARTDNTADQHLLGHASPDVWLLLIQCLSRLLPTKGVLFVSLLVVGDVNVTQCMHVVIRVGTNFC